ncbi:MAG TPA: ABC transporter ATP-binding protein [Ignavibacteria bacterium]|nr:ABC transporter ATP-binding protein [Ignavibacteria bacterium]HMR40684.1 ABC transporter ATP-binding protein [Ignavibacteria bacterium]
MHSIEIKCENLSKSFSGKNIFKGFSYNFTSGSSAVITGRNGSGKSTLVKVISNLIQPSKGSISVKIKDKQIPGTDYFRYTGLVSPYLNLYDELTGFENLTFFYELKSDGKSAGSEKNEKIDFYLNKVNMYERRNDVIRTYSTGMKQKLKIAFALMNQPEILILDEPGSNLDKEGKDLIKNVCDEQKEKGLLILATNNEREKEYCSEVINIEDYK